MILNNSIEAFILYHANSLQSVQQQWYYCVREYVNIYTGWCCASRGAAERLS